MSASADPSSTQPGAPARPERAANASGAAILAYVGPFLLFVLWQAVPALVHVDPAAGVPLWRSAPEMWVYPLQTWTCAIVLACFQRLYPPARLGTAALAFGALAGAVVFGLWISPQWLFHAAPRTTGGFDPTILLGPGAPGHEAGRMTYYLALVLRFTRLALIVPLLEEIFWRGFLLRYLAREAFLELPFGACARMSFAVVTLGFTFEHSRPDWPAALLTGVLYNLVAIRTRSLGACVLAHGLTNLLLGLYVLQTHQWGFW